MRRIVAILVTTLIASSSSIGADVPANATASIMGGWNCNLGYKKVGNGCIEMSPTEKQRQLAAIAAARARQRSATINVDGERFTLRDVERKCEVWRWSESWGDVECSGSKFNIVEKKCEAWFPNGEGSQSGEIDCSGSELRPIENCSVEMYSESYGDIDC